MCFVQRRWVLAQPRALRTANTKITQIQTTTLTDIVGTCFTSFLLNLFYETCKNNLLCNACGSERRPNHFTGDIDIGFVNKLWDRGLLCVKLEFHHCLLHLRNEDADFYHCHSCRLGFSVLVGGFVSVTRCTAVSAIAAGLRSAGRHTPV